MSVSSDQQNITTYVDIIEEKDLITKAKFDKEKAIANKSFELSDEEIFHIITDVNMVAFHERRRNQIKLYNAEQMITILKKFWDGRSYGIDLSDEYPPRKHSYLSSDSSSDSRDDVNNSSDWTWDDLTPKSTNNVIDSSSSDKTNSSSSDSTEDKTNSSSSDSPEDKTNSSSSDSPEDKTNSSSNDSQEDISDNSKEKSLINDFKFHMIKCKRFFYNYEKQIGSTGEGFLYNNKHKNYIDDFLKNGEGKLSICGNQLSNKLSPENTVIYNFFFHSCLINEAENILSKCLEDCHYLSFRKTK